jgi:uncharacterized membrane protein YhfC
MVVVLLAFSLGTCAPTDKGMLSIKCDGTTAETQFIADQRGAETRNDARWITGDGGYVIYRIPVGNCTPEQLYYSVSSTSYSLEFSADGRSWSVMVSTPRSDEQPGQFGRSANGFLPEWQKAAKKTGTAYFRFSRPAGGKVPLVIKSINIEVTGGPLTKGFHTPREDFRSSWFRSERKSALSLPALLMMLVGLSAVLLAKWRWRTPLRLFGLGALLWTISIAVKFAIAIPLSKPVEALLHQALPKHPADVTFWIYIGFLTGFTEVAIFLAMARWFQRRQWSWRDAASVGVGFGAIEAVLLGLGVAIAVATGMPGPSTLAPALERFLTIFIHIATVVAPIYAVTRRKWGWFALAFIHKSGVDAVAAYILLAGSHLMAAHPWRVELVIFGPFAYIAIPILLVLRKRWKLDTETKPTGEHYG